jgi:co-chaperonin GroES (HSP10)
MKTYEAPEQHDWTFLEALGDWIVAEQVGVIARTRTGIHVPDNARMAVWIVYSAGPDVHCVKRGDRVLFDGRTPHNVDGRLFALLKVEHMIATLPMPELSAEQDDAIPDVVPNGATSGPAAAVKSRLILPS